LLAEVAKYSLVYEGAVIDRAVRRSSNGGSSDRPAYVRPRGQRGMLAWSPRMPGMAARASPMARRGVFRAVTLRPAMNVRGIGRAGDGLDQPVHRQGRVAVEVTRLYAASRPIASCRRTGSARPSSTDRGRRSGAYQARIRSTCPASGVFANRSMVTRQTRRRFARSRGLPRLGRGCPRAGGPGGQVTARADSCLVHVGGGLLDGRRQLAQFGAQLSGPGQVGVRPAGGDDPGQQRGGLVRPEHVQAHGGRG
jgi:hypothetical protein